MIFKSILAAAFFFTAQPGIARADSIVGQWVYFEKIYQGQVMPNPPDAPLRLHFDFDSKGQSHLYWWHEGQGDHCERWGVFSVEGNTLTETATTVNPANTFDCGDDPDMQAGKVSQTAISFEKGNLLMDIGLSGEPFFYVWKNQNQGGL